MSSVEKNAIFAPVVAALGSDGTIESWLKATEFLVGAGVVEGEGGVGWNSLRKLVKQNNLQREKTVAFDAPTTMRGKSMSYTGPNFMNI